MNGGIDQQVQQAQLSAGSNPQKLAQQYGKSRNLIDLLAMQKLKSEKEAATKEMQMQMQTQPQTIIEQREAELMGLTQQEVMGKIAPGMQKAGQASMPPQGMPPQGQPPQGPPPDAGFAAGGIVGYAAGGDVEPLNPTAKEIIAMLRAGEFPETIIAKMGGGPDAKELVERVAAQEVSSPATAPPAPPSDAVYAGLDAKYGAPEGIASLASPPPAAQQTTPADTMVDGMYAQTMTPPTPAMPTPATSTPAAPVYQNDPAHGMPVGATSGAPTKEAASVGPDLLGGIANLLPATGRRAQESATSINKAKDRAGLTGALGAGIRAIPNVGAGLLEDAVGRGAKVAQYPLKALDSMTGAGAKLIDEITTGGSSDQQTLGERFGLYDSKDKASASAPTPEPTGIAAAKPNGSVPKHLDPKSQNMPVSGKSDVIASLMGESGAPAGTGVAEGTGTIDKSPLDKLKEAQEMAMYKTNTEQLSIDKAAEGQAALDRTIAGTKGSRATGAERTEKRKGLEALMAAQNDPNKLRNQKLIAMLSGMAGQSTAGRALGNAGRTGLNVGNQQEKSQKLDALAIQELLDSEYKDQYADETGALSAYSNAEGDAQTAVSQASQTGANIYSANQRSDTAREVAEGVRETNALLRENADYGKLQGRMRQLSADRIEINKQKLQRIDDIYGMDIKRLREERQEALADGDKKTAIARGDEIKRLEASIADQYESDLQSITHQEAALQQRMGMESQMASNITGDWGKARAVSQ